MTSLVKHFVVLTPGEITWQAAVYRAYDALCIIVQAYKINTENVLEEIHLQESGALAHTAQINLLPITS